MTEPIGRAERRAAERDKKRQTRMSVSGNSAKSLASLINRPTRKTAVNRRRGSR